MHTRHIRDRLILAGLIIIVPLIIWSAVDERSQLRERRALEIADCRKTADTIANACIDYAHDVVALQRTIGVSLCGRRAIPRSRATAELKNVIRRVNKVRHLAVADANGIVFASDVPHLIGCDARDFPHARRVLQKTGWAISDALPAEDDSEYPFGLATGIKDAEGKLQGLVMASSDQKILEKNLLGGRMGTLTDTDQVVITDSKGFVIFTCGGTGLGPGQRRWAQIPFIREALAGKPASVERFRMPDGRVTVGAVEPIRELGWTAGIFVPEEAVTGPVRRRVLIRTLIVLGIVGLATGLTAYLGNRLSRPIRHLAHTAHSFGTGNLEARADVRTGDELEDLGSKFNEMADALQKHTSQLNSSLESQRRQSERFSTLYTLAQGLVVTMTLDARLELIAHALASICGMKRCAIFLKRNSRLVGTAGWGLMHPESFAGMVLEVSESGELAGRDLMAGAPVIVQDIQTDRRIGSGFHRMLSDLSVEGLLALPLVRRRHAVGLAILDNPGDRPYCDQESVEAAKGLADLAAIAIENAEAFEKWLRIAQALQGSLLPPAPEKAGPFAFAASYYSAVEAADLGGDFYDFVPLPDGRTGLVIADMSGKGLEAAVFTAMAKYALRAFISEQSDPGPALTRTNKSLAQAAGDWGFVTMFYGVLDTKTGRLTYANAGHPPSVIARASGEVHQLPCTEQQPPVGIVADIEYTQAECELSAGDTLVCYTDGAIEARSDSEQFEVDRLMRVAANSRHLPPNEIADAIHRAVLDFSQGRLQDDIALLVVQREQAQAAD